MKTTFTKTPQCEVCGKEPATSFSAMSDSGGGFTDWKFCGGCTSDSEKYYIELDRFFGSPGSTVDWLAHLHEKEGMDWPGFMGMMVRFRHATDSYNSL